MRLKAIPDSVAGAIDAVSEFHNVGHTFVREDGEGVYHSFAALREEVAARSGALVDIGLRKGDTFALSVPDPREFVITFLGALLQGVVAVPIYPPASFVRTTAFLESASAMLRRARAR